MLLVGMLPQVVRGERVQSGGRNSLALSGGLFEQMRETILCWVFGVQGFRVQEGSGSGARLERLFPEL
jgi:hypothetical protein